MSYETLVYSTDGAIATITLNRPEDLNTIVPPMTDELEAAVAEAVRDHAIKVIVLRGAGRAFCAGFNFGTGFHHWDNDITTDGEWDAGKDFVATCSPVTGWVPKFMSLWHSPKPVIAMVHGWCLGGGSEMALCSDIVIMSEDARIGTPYSRMWGCHHAGMWVHRLGLAKAKELALTGRPLSGPEAVECGLVNKAVPFAGSRGGSVQARRRARLDSVVAARGDEAHREPGVREPGPELDAAARFRDRRPHAQHARGESVHRLRGERRCASRGRAARRPVRRLLAGIGRRQAESEQQLSRTEGLPE